MNSCMEIITNPFDLSRVLLEFHHNLRFLEIRVGKTPYGTRRVWNPTFEVGFMIKWQVIELGFRTNPN